MDDNQNIPNDAPHFPAQVIADSSLSGQPEWRMGNSERLLEIVKSCDTSPSRLRFLDVCAEVDDMYDRRPPDSPEDLRLDGLGWMANVDWGGMEFGIDSAVAPEYNLFHKPRTYIDIEAPRYNGSDYMFQKKVIERIDKRMLDDHEEWIPESAKMLFQRKLYGLGIMYFRQPRSWHFQSVHPANLLTNCPTMNPRKWSWCAIKTEFDITDLLQYLGDSDLKEDKQGFAQDGWNRKSIRRALTEHAENNKDRPGFGWDQYMNSAESWKQEYLGSDLYYAARNDLMIPGYIVYVKEFTGEVTEYLITQWKEIGFLYRSPKAQRLKQMSDYFVLFPENPWQNAVLESRGYGIKNLSFFDAENIMLNHWLDTSKISSSLMIKGGSADDIYNQGSEIQIGAFTMIPDSLDIIASQMPDTGRVYMPLMEHLSQRKQAAGPITGGEGLGSAPDRETKYAAGLRASKAQRLQNFQLDFTHSRKDVFHRIRFARYMGDGMVSGDPGYEHAQVYLGKMLEQGVTKEFIEALDLTATNSKRIPGDGDPVKLYQDLSTMMPLMGLMTEEGKKVYVSDIGDAQVGHIRSKEYFGEASRDPNLEQNRRMAELENGHIETSDARLNASGDDNHLVHASQHLDFMEAKAQAYQDGALDPRTLFEILSRGMAHVGVNEDAQPVGGHIAPLFEDPSGPEQGQQAMQRMAELVNLRRQLEQQLAAQQQSEQEQQLQNLKMPLEEQAKAQKVAEETRSMAEKASIEVDLMREKLDYEREKNQLEIQLLREKLKDARSQKQTDE